MRNKLSDLNNHLFEQLERLNDDELTDEDLSKEIKRGHAISELATNIVELNNTVLKAQKMLIDYGCDDVDLKPLIEMK